ncbi:hypothetical protein FE257_000496 [Aspergillus nanangensis]|uniref:Uncharacterized protein n=1 Tax=Aspergillus nanangensis TaxID=2582783 RepID=A0AAD4GWL5_ASPNN|nr:hypothetical protein FE257_000496 [Aspergillus nanangensis]
MANPQPVASPKRSRGFSLGGRSEKSHRSSNSANRNKIHLTESAEEKYRRSLHTKADPMIAMSEAQPMTVALEKSNLGNLREIQHKDQWGNVITDPDHSNPTRPRLERPLDTIRSFEVAIYGTHSSRPVSYVKTEPEAGHRVDYSRRSSYFGGHNNGYSNRGYSEQDAYYNGRGAYSRPDSYVESNYGSGAQPENYYPYNQTGGRPRPPRHNQRMNSDYSGNNGYAQNGYAQNGYAQNGYHKSSDNMTGSGSGSNHEPWGNSTDPSSVNSSIDHLQQQQQQQQQQRVEEKAVGDNYGFQGFGPGPNLNNHNRAMVSGGAGPSRIALGNNSTVPATASNSGGPVGGGVPTRRALRKSNNVVEAPAETKRKSWFKRRFSKD